MMFLAHVGEPPAPHDLWTSWHADPVIFVGLAVAVALYLKGARHTDSRRRRTSFHLGIVSLWLALSSPLDAAAESLASAHMIQHLVLTSIVAPLLVYARPWPAMRRALPRRLAPSIRIVERRTGLGRATSPFRHPGVALLAGTATFWIWHASEPYTAALHSEVVHGLSHLSYLAAGLLVWNVVRTAGQSGRPDRPAAVGLLFALGLQGTVLASLMTFANRPWYDAYEATTPAWGIDSLTDQQLAGLLMWFPSSVAYLIAALWLLWGWLVSADSAPHCAEYASRAEHST